MVRLSTEMRAQTDDRGRLRAATRIARVALAALALAACDGGGKPSASKQRGLSDWLVECSPFGTYDGGKVLVFDYDGGVDLDRGDNKSAWDKSAPEHVSGRWTCLASPRSITSCNFRPAAIPACSPRRRRPRPICAPCGSARCTRPTARTRRIREPRPDCRPEVERVGAIQVGFRHDSSGAALIFGAAEFSCVSTELCDKAASNIDLVRLLSTLALRIERPSPPRSSPTI